MKVNSVGGTRLSTSSWSLHRALGITYPDSPAQPNTGAHEAYGRGTVILLDVPARLAAMGIHTLEICHFHLPSREPAYLDELRSAAESAGVQLFSLLIDDGDITHPQNGVRDLDWIGGWIDTAGALGTERVRVVAGKSQPSPDALQRSIEGLTVLAERGKANGVRVTTENWMSLLSTPEYVLRVLDAVDIGLCADFGNWSGASKYDDLAAIFPRAESCHAKCSFAAPYTPDRDDYLRCLDLTRTADFSGPYTLIYDGPGNDEWQGLAIESELVRLYISNN